MAKLTDEDIRRMSKVSIQDAANYLGISANLVTIGLRNNLLPIGFAVKKDDRPYSSNYTYAIIPERLIAYNHGKINEVQIDNIEKSINSIVNSFEEMKRDLVFLLKENEESEG